MASDPTFPAFQVVVELVHEPKLDGYHPRPSVRGDLLFKPGRREVARAEFEPRGIARAQRAGTAARAVGGVRQARSGQASRPPGSRDVAFGPSACATMASVP